MVLLAAFPPGVFTENFPVLAPWGTVAVIDVPEFNVYAALALPSFTCVAPVNPDPVIATLVPAGPLAGEIALTTGVTKNVRLLVNVPEGMVTVTKPALPLSGTTAVM